MRVLILTARGIVSDVRHLTDCKNYSRNKEEVREGGKVLPIHLFFLMFQMTVMALVMWWRWRCGGVGDVVALAMWWR
jgi:hypothetical protein